MLDKDLIYSICQIYGVNKVGIKENKDSLDLIIFEMNNSISLEKWNYFENILRELTNKDICIMDVVQVRKHFGNEYLEKGLVIL